MSNVYYVVVRDLFVRTQGIKVCKVRYGIITRMLFNNYEIIVIANSKNIMSYYNFFRMIYFVVFTVYNLPISFIPSD